MIRVLEKKVADKIAAGEVIDRPVSIVKELVENSIDAGADNITVEIRNGGKTYIRVTDNGCGIAADEAELAFKRHATSKITYAEDLDSIHTLGFRGEALASICAVAKVELITKTTKSKIGRRIITEGSDILESTGTGCPEGTTITVRDLFYNVPARLKFLASDNAETRRITDLVSRIALAYGDIKITLINGSSKLFVTRGKGNILNSIVSVYGKDIATDLLPVENTSNGLILKGFVSSPASSVASRSKQIFCVNGRVVSSKVMETALDEAYKEKLFAGRFPIAFLFLALPADKLDVNIHPTKKEVRFDDKFEVSDFITKSIIKALSSKEAVPQIRSKNLKEPIQSETISGLRVEEKNTVIKSYDTASENFKTEKKADSGENLRVDINKLLSGLRKEHNSERESYDDTYIMHNVPAEDTHAEKEAYLRSGKNQFEPFDFNSLKSIGTIFNTYIMACDDDSFYLIDQHAAHERIFYEKLITQYNNEEKSSQQLMLPLNFNVSADVAVDEDLWIKKLRSMGYNIENFGDKTYIVREIPAFMELGEAEAFLFDFFNELDGKPDLNNRKTLDKIIMKACKSAVKGGDLLRAEEIDALMKDLKNCVNPFSCPHGRPTFIRITKYEIEKMFKRV